MKRSTTLLALVGVALFAAGCHTDMWVQPKLRPQEPSDFESYSDRSASRPDVFGTVARGKANLDDGYYKGIVNRQYVTEIPAEQAEKELGLKNYEEFIKRGQDRFTIYCTPCHGQLGDGNGMIAQRGLKLKRPPATYHTDRLRNMPVGHFYDVITNGYGVMFSYAARVETPDRWAIVAYIRALQLSQNMPASKLTPEQIARIDKPQKGTGSDIK